MVEPHPVRAACNRVAVAALLGTAALVSTSCRENWASYGATPVAADRNAGDVVAAFERFLTRPARGDGFGPVETRLRNEILIPSGLFDDDIWSAKRGETRKLYLHGELSPVDESARYRLTPHVNREHIPHPGDAHYDMTLQRLPDGAFRWETLDEYGASALTRADATRIFRSLIGVAEGKPAARLLADVAGATPHGSAALGRGLTLQRLATAPRPDGATVVDLEYAVRADLLAKAGFERLAEFVDDYLGPMTFSATLLDRAGRERMTYHYGESVGRLRYAVHNADLVPLDGGLDALDDTLTLRMDLSMEVALFTVGVHDVIADMTLVRGAGELGWRWTLTQQPRWELPGWGMSIVREALRRPFADEGILYQLSVVERPGQPSRARRRIRATLAETPVMSFVGAIIRAISSDFGAATEREGYRFFHDVAVALQKDLGALELGSVPVGRATAVGIR